MSTSPTGKVKNLSFYMQRLLLAQSLFRLTKTIKLADQSCARKKFQHISSFIFALATSPQAIQTHTSMSTAPAGK